MRIFKTKGFAKFAKRERISDSSLEEAVERAEKGLVDADLGGGVIKQRVPRNGQGRSKGYRAILAFRMNKRSVFLHGFAKNEVENISNDELDIMKEIASIWLNADERKIKLSCEEGILLEIKYEKEG